MNWVHSRWWLVISDIPQISAVGSVLFHIFINDIDEEIKCTLSTYTDNRNLGRAVNLLEVRKALQSNLDWLVRWAKSSSMTLNPTQPDRIEEQWLESLPAEKDLCVLADSCTWASTEAKMTNSILACNSNNMVRRTKEATVPLLWALVRIHLKYYVHFWSLHYEKDPEFLELVQRREIKLVRGLENKTYENHPRKLGLFTLKRRRLSRCLIAPYNNLGGGCNRGVNLFSQTINDRTQENKSQPALGKF